MKIISIDMNASSPEQGLATRRLILDNMASVEWKTLFENIHRNRVDFHKREVSIAGKEIMVNCCMDEIQHQIDSLNAICKEADDQLLAAHAQAQAAEQERVRMQEEKRRAAHEQFGKLKF